MPLELWKWSVCFWSQRLHFPTLHNILSISFDAFGLVFGFAQTLRLICLVIYVNMHFVPVPSSWKLSPSKIDKTTPRYFNFLRNQSERRREESDHAVEKVKRRKYGHKSYSKSLRCVYFESYKEQIAHIPVIATEIDLFNKLIEINFGGCHGIELEKIVRLIENPQMNYCHVQTLKLSRSSDFYQP